MVKDNKMAKMALIMQSHIFKLCVQLSPFTKYYRKWIFNQELDFTWMFCYCVLNEEGSLKIIQ